MQIKLHFGPQHRIEILNQLVAETKGRIFSATFIKKDGTTRDITARLGVKKNQHGGINTLDNYSQYVTVFDMHADGYRAINLETLKRISCGNKTYTINNDAADGSLEISEVTA